MLLLFLAVVIVEYLVARYLAYSSTLLLVEDEDAIACIRMLSSGVRFWAGKWHISSLRALFLCCASVSSQFAVSASCTSVSSEVAASSTVIAGIGSSVICLRDCRKSL